FQAEDGIRDFHVTGFRRVLFRSRNGIPYDNAAGGNGEITIGGQTVEVGDLATYGDRITAAVIEAGYPPRADPARLNTPAVIAILTVLVLLVTMVYGPIAALLVELFPARIRYSAMSLPYHIGNGWFGGFLPTIAFAMVAATGDIYAGLWYPIGVAVLTVIVGLLFLPETFRRRVA